MVLADLDTDTDTDTDTENELVFYDSCPWVNKLMNMFYLGTYKN